MTFEIMRAKTIDLFESPLTPQQDSNAQLNKKEALEGKIILDSYPRRLVLELTTACNYRCVMCGRDVADFPIVMLKKEYIEKLKYLFDVSGEVTLFGWGEPTLHPDFLDLLKYFDLYPLRKYFVTNGSTLSKFQDAMFNYHLNILAVSLDGALANTNDRIRKGANFNKIISSLKNMVTYRNKNKKTEPYINFVFTCMKSNISELGEMVMLTHHIGIEELKVVYLTVFSENLLRETLWDNQDIVSAEFDKCINIAKQLGVRIKLPYIQGHDPAGQLSHRPCYVAWRDLFVGADGYIRPCQSTSLKLFHISKYDNINDMWNSKEYVEFRKRVNDASTMPIDCRNCYQSSHANWNKKSSFIQLNNKFAPRWDSTND